MIIPAILAHAALGAVLSFLFVLYYIVGDGRWKGLVQAFLGIGGNAGIVFMLERFLSDAENSIKLYGIFACMISFLVSSAVFLWIISKAIHDKNENIKLRDIFLGQFTYIKKYYESRAHEIDTKLSYEKLKEREATLEAREAALRIWEEQLNVKSEYLTEELRKLETLGQKKPKLLLPEHNLVTLTRDYTEVMPSYISDMITCIKNISSYTDEFLKKSKEDMTQTLLKSYFVAVATWVCGDLFGSPTQDVRVHFRIYDKQADGYKKYVAVMGRKFFSQTMTTIPCSTDSMIKRSYECRHSLIKSINSDHDYQSGNFRLWNDYLTYTFYGLTYEGKPYLSFGISVKNARRYKMHLQLLNYFEFERYLQSNVERIDEAFNISELLYGEVE